MFYNWIELGNPPLSFINTHPVLLALSYFRFHPCKVAGIWRKGTEWFSSKMCLHLYQCNQHMLIQVRKRVHISNNCKDCFDCKMQNKKKVPCCIPFSVLTSVICHVLTPSTSSLIVCAWPCISSEEVTYNMIMILTIIVTGFMSVRKKVQTNKQINKQINTFLLLFWVGYVCIFLFKPDESWY